MKLDDVLKPWFEARKKLPLPLCRPLSEDLDKLRQDDEKIGDFDAYLKHLQAARTTAATTLANLKNAKPSGFHDGVKAVEAIQKYLQTRVNEVTKLRKDLNDAYGAIAGAGLNFLTHPGPGMAPEVQRGYKRLYDLTRHLKTPKFEPEAKAMVVLAYEIVDKQKSDGPGKTSEAVIEFQNALRKDLESAKAVLIP